MLTVEIPIEAHCSTTCSVEFLPNSSHCEMHSVRPSVCCDNLLQRSVKRRTGDSRCRWRRKLRTMLLRGMQVSWKQR